MTLGRYAGPVDANPQNLAALLDLSSGFLLAAPLWDNVPSGRSN